MYRDVKWIAPTWTASIGGGELRVYGEGVVHNIDMVLYTNPRARWRIEPVEGTLFMRELHDGGLWVGEPGERSYGLHLPRVSVDEKPASNRGMHVSDDGARVLGSPYVPACEWSVDLPFWFPLALCVVPTAYLWWRRGRRIPPGHCRKCGYNLTGNVSGRCPECGSAVAAGALRPDQLDGSTSEKI